MEKICFELKHVEVSYLDKEIVKINRLAVHQFDRIGIVGKNGTGKSTILKLLAGIKEPTKGQVHRHVEFGYFKQLEPPSKESADLSLIGKLAIPKHSEQLSGGEQTKLKLAQLFTNYYEALLIDEPTTHLDQSGISFLLDELRHYYGALLLISHDRTVLDELVTMIWEIDGGKIQVYSGNYSDYLAQKKAEEEQQTQAHEQFIKEKSRLKKAAQDKMKKAEKIAQAKRMSKKEAKAKANRMFETKSKGSSEKAMYRSAKSIEQRIEKLTEIEAVQQERPLIFHQSKSLKLHNKYPIMADLLTLRVEDQVLLNEVSFQLPLGKKIAITGRNGTGKSTLLNHIANNGEGLTISPKAKIGFFQQMSYQLASNETIIDFLKGHSEYDEGFLRSVLHSMRFVGNDIRKSVNQLSGGEVIRLKLCQLFIGAYNILLLDEPTNFLDIHAIHALERFIAGYEGTVVFVSHDQTFIKNVADIQFVISDGNINRA